MLRRDFLATSALALAGCAVPQRRAGLVLVGTYTERTGSRGLHRFRVADDGAWAPLGAVDVGPNPSFLAVHPGGRVVYVVNEVTHLAGEPTGAVRAFALDPATGALTPLGEPRATGGGAPCYVSVDATGRLLMVANYVGGSVAAFPLGEDGAIGARRFLDQHAGRGTRADRQEGPHAHCVLPAPGNRWAVSTDLGLDRLTVHALDAAAGTLAPVATTALHPGAGPRHLAFHPAGHTLYVVGELDLTLAALPFDAERGTLGAAEVVPLLDGAPSARSTAADLHVHPSGRFLYASVRGDDALVTLALDVRGRPSPVARVPSGGRQPRNFALDPSGAMLHAANQESGEIVAFRIDPDDGTLAPDGARVVVPAPVCVVFV